MKTTHTPGPWRVERQNPSPTSGEWMIAGGKPGYLAEVRDCGSGDVQANARLIAAAPDLLAELQNIANANPNEWAEETRDQFQLWAQNRARAAIAKATGYTEYNAARIAWELERTAMGDGFYGNALRVAKDIPGVTSEDRSLLDRYATGTNSGTDHVELQALALRIDAIAKAIGEQQ